MRPISYKRHRFRADVIRHAIWQHCRFTLSVRVVEEPLTQRGIEFSYETIPCWTLKLGRLFARDHRRTRPKPTGRWHLDAIVVKIGGKGMFLRRAVDDEGEVLDMLVQERRNKAAAVTLLRTLLRNHGVQPEPIATGRAGCERTIGRRTRICRSGDGSESG